MLRVVVLRVLFFVDMRLPLVFSVADLYGSKIVFTLSYTQITIIDTRVIIRFI